MYATGMRKLITALVLGAVILLPVGARAQTVEREEEIHVQLEVLLAQLIQMVAQLQAQLSAQIAAQSEQLTEQSTHVEIIKKRTMSQDEKLERIERNTEPKPSTTPEPKPESRKELIVKAEGNRVTITVLDDDGKPVRCAPFEVTVDGERLHPERSLCTNTRAGKSERWFAEIDVPEGAEKVEVSADGMTERVTVAARPS